MFISIAIFDYVIETARILFVHEVPHVQTENVERFHQQMPWIAVTLFLLVHLFIGKGLQTTMTITQVCLSQTFELELLLRSQSQFCDAF